jgi:hypothetical protein
MPNLNQPKRPIFVIGQSRATPLSILTVYRHPKDHPDKYVVREFILDVDGQLLARKSCDLADTLEEARKFIPEGRCCFSEPNTPGLPAVESWI